MSGKTKDLKGHKDNLETPLDMDTCLESPVAFDRACSRLEGTRQSHLQMQPMF